jgi:hypothetical protein
LKPTTVWQILTLAAGVHEMGMEEHDGLNPDPAAVRRSMRGGGGGGGGGSGSGYAAGEDTEEEGEEGATGVTLTADVAPVGQGFFVTGEVASVIRVECECCGCAFMQRVAAPVKVRQSSLEGAS